ncbi:hypothetical protein LCGC14_1901610 [marine sediment metagenome]|uniref:Uncharacterized protein n=1 Tax=marine sediment metagenome TaxID=412755 RepID=A0A0F9GJU3_9ZZZZ
MKILILDNLFKKNYKIKYKILNNFLTFYKKIKLESLIQNLIKKYNNKIEFKIISNGNIKFSVINNINIELISDFRINLDRSKFLEIKEKIKRRTKQNLKELLRNLNCFSISELNNISLGNVLEVNFLRYFNSIFGEFEIIKHIILTGSYDRIILFDYNQSFLEFYKSISNSKIIEFYPDILFNKKRNLVKLSYSIYILGLCRYSLTSFRIRFCQ